MSANRSTKCHTQLVSCKSRRIKHTASSILFSGVDGHFAFSQVMLQVRWLVQVYLFELICGRLWRLFFADVFAEVWFLRVVLVDEVKGRGGRRHDIGAAMIRDEHDTRMT
jgi:hypothetical protein